MEFVTQNLLIRLDCALDYNMSFLSTRIEFLPFTFQEKIEKTLIFF